MNSLEFDKPREECGVFAVHLAEPADVAALCHLGLFALQHRGQESCGIRISNGDEIRIEKDMGSVSEVFTEARLDTLHFENTWIGIGHTRYSTTGSSLRFNAQPLTVRSNKGLLALIHNGNFTNARALRYAMLDEGAVFQTTNDSEVMINLIARYSHLSLSDATARVMGELEGGFSVVIMDKNKILGLRDRNGVRPLVISELDGGYVFASEPSALHVVGASFLRDVRPGELVVADDSGLHSRQVLPSAPTPCAFEWIYFARGDGALDGADVHAARVRMGEVLAQEAPAGATLSSVCPNPAWRPPSATRGRLAFPTTSDFTSRPMQGAPSSIRRSACAT